MYESMTTHAGGGGGGGGGEGKIVFPLSQCVVMNQLRMSSALQVNRTKPRFNKCENK